MGRCLAHARWPWCQVLFQITNDELREITNIQLITGVPVMQIFTAKYLDQLDPMGFVIIDKGKQSMTGNNHEPGQDQWQDMHASNPTITQVRHLKAL